MAAKPTVDGLQRKDNGKIVEILRKSYVEIRNKRIEETLLEITGLTTKEFDVS